MELNEVMRTTFSARDYTGEGLPDDVLYDILDNARFEPRAAPLFSDFNDAPHRRLAFEGELDFQRAGLFRGKV